MPILTKETLQNAHKIIQRTTNRNTNPDNKLTKDRHKHQTSNPKSAKILSRRKLQASSHE